MSADAVMFARAEEEAKKNAANPLRAAYRKATREDEPSVLSLHSILIAALPLAVADMDEANRASAPGTNNPGALNRYKAAMVLVRDIKDTITAIEECARTIAACAK